MKRESLSSMLSDGSARKAHSPPVVPVVFLVDVPPAVAAAVDVDAFGWAADAHPRTEGHAGSGDDV